LDKHSTGTKAGSWKRRYFVLSDNLRWYGSEEEFKEDPDSFRGSVLLNCFFASILSSPSDGSTPFQFILHASPKSLVAKAESEEEMKRWVEALNNQGK